MSVTLELDRATKAFGSVHALVDGSILLRGGEVHALLGENGAGKSTLVKILAGVYQPDSGELRIDGEPTVLAGTAASRSAGISVIYQEPTLFPDLSVAENIFMGRQPLNWGRHIDRGAMNAAATEVFERLGVALDPTRPARGLSVADQQIVEIAKAISFDARVIVMDEPTAALTAIEVERLFTVVRTLRAEGAAVLFISHRLEEVFANCQRVTIMRDGRFVRTDPIEDLDIDTVIRSMVGRDLDTLFPKTDTAPGEVVLSVEHLSRRGEFNDVSFTVRRGEIVALAGLVGAGRSEIARAIFGIDRYDAGRVRDRRQPAAERLADRRHARRCGLRARGPSPARPRHGDEHRPQRGPGVVADDSSTWVCCGAPPSASSPPSGPAVCSSSSPRSPTTCRRSPVATSRRSCSASGSPVTPSC